MNKKSTKSDAIIVSPDDIRKKVDIKETSENLDGLSVYVSDNVYLTAFLISQENFNLGKVWIPDITKDTRAKLEVKYDPKYQNLLMNYIDLFEKHKAVVNLFVYQQNIRFVMHLVNQRKSNL